MWIIQIILADYSIIFHGPLDNKFDAIRIATAIKEKGSDKVITVKTHYLPSTLSQIRRHRLWKKK